MHGSFAAWSRRCILSAAFAGFLPCAGPPARAGITVSVQSVSAAAGTSGNTLEVDVQNTGASVDIAAFSFEILVPSGSGVTFTGADISTSLATYIFAGNSFFGPDIAFSTGTTLDAGDLAVTGSTTLGSGGTLGLGLVSFDLAAGAPLGPVTVSLTGYPFTSLTDPDQSNVPIDTLEAGTITISGGAVPEPSSLILGTLGFLGAACLVRTHAAVGGVNPAVPVVGIERTRGCPHELSPQWILGARRLTRYWHIRCLTSCSSRTSTTGRRTIPFMATPTIPCPLPKPAS